jgi:F0F1-type ATP synthase assembly protein I
MAQSETDRRGVLRNLLIVLVGQVGCITLVIILLSVRLGLWLDAYFQTRPLYTLILLFAGIPLSVLLMLVVARKTLARLTKDKPAEEEKVT